MTFLQKIHAVCNADNSNDDCCNDLQREISLHTEKACAVDNSMDNDTGNDALADKEQHRKAKADRTGIDELAQILRKLRTTQ